MRLSIYISVFMGFPAELFLQFFNFIKNFLLFLFAFECLLLRNHLLVLLNA